MHSQSTETVRGTVVRFDETKGFGFISPEDGGEDVFVHFSAIQMPGYRTLVPDQRVEFEIRSDSPKGRRAVGVKVINQ
jgi:CspA family cold shock protein